MNNCVFCKIITNGSALLTDSILYEDSDFFIVPALGCLVPGYILLISKEHAASMSALDQRKKNKLELAINKISDFYSRKYGFYPIVFEHGAAENAANTSGCCVKHAHIHITPCNFGSTGNMAKNLNLHKIDSFGSMFIERDNKPYIFFMDNNKEKYINALPDVFPSQIIRKWIAHDLGIPKEWNWKTNPFLPNILQTVIEIGNLLRAFRYSDGNNYFRNIYYCRAMDGLNGSEIQHEYDSVKSKLSEIGLTLVNPYINLHHYDKSLSDKEIGARLARENLAGIEKADCVVVNLTIKGHPYMGCIDEMINANMKGKYVIVIVGESGYENKKYTHFRSDKIVKTLDEAFAFIRNHCIML